MEDVVKVEKGRDYVIEFRIREGDGEGDPILVTLSGYAPKDATSLSIEADHPGLSDGDVLCFGKDILITLSADCEPGDQTLAVEAIPCSLDTGNQLAKLMDMSGKDVKMVVLRKAGDLAASALIPDSAFTMTIPTQTGQNYALVRAAGAKADTAGKPANSYFGTIWRRDAGETRPLHTFVFKLVEAGGAGFA